MLAASRPYERSTLSNQAQSSLTKASFSVYPEESNAALQVALDAGAKDGHTTSPVEFCATKFSQVPPTQTKTIFLQEERRQTGKPSPSFQEPTIIDVTKQPSVEAKQEDFLQPETTSPKSTSEIPSSLSENNLPPFLALQKRLEKEVEKYQYSLQVAKEGNDSEQVKVFQEMLKFASLSLKLQNKLLREEVKKTPSNSLKVTSLQKAFDSYQGLLSSSQECLNSQKQEASSSELIVLYGRINLAYHNAAENFLCAVRKETNSQKLATLYHTAGESSFQEALFWKSQKERPQGSLEEAETLHRCLAETYSSQVKIWEQGLNTSQQLRLNRESEESEQSSSEGDLPEEYQKADELFSLWRKALTESFKKRAPYPEKLYKKSISTYLLAAQERILERGNIANNYSDAAFFYKAALDRQQQETKPKPSSSSLRRSGKHFSKTQLPPSFFLSLAESYKYLGNIEKVLLSCNQENAMAREKALEFFHQAHQHATIWNQKLQRAQLASSTLIEEILEQPHQKLIESYLLAGQEASLGNLEIGELFAKSGEAYQKTFQNNSFQKTAFPTWEEEAAYHWNQAEIRKELLLEEQKQQKGKEESYALTHCYQEILSLYQFWDSEIQILPQQKDSSKTSYALYKEKVAQIQEAILLFKTAIEKIKNGNFVKAGIFLEKATDCKNNLLQK